MVGRSRPGLLAPNRPMHPDSRSRHVGTQRRRLSAILLVIFGSVAASVAAADWEGARVEREMIHAITSKRAAADTYFGAAYSATHSGCRAALVEGNDLDGFAVRVDGKLGARYSEIALSTPVFSEDGSSVAYCALRRDGWCWVVNGVEETVFPAITATSFAFSANGKRHAYLVKPNLKRITESLLIVDGAPAPKVQPDDPGPFDTAPVFSPDGSRLAFVEFRREGAVAAMRVNLDGKGGRWHGRGLAFNESLGFGRWVPSPRSLGPASAVGVQARPLVAGMGFSPDGRHFYQKAEIDGGYAVFVDDTTGPVYQNLGFDFTFAPRTDPVDYAYLAESGSRHLLVRAKAAPIIVANLADWTLTYSPDGRRLAFAGTRDGNKAIWVDGAAAACDVPIADFGNFRSIRFSPDSKRLAFTIQTKRQVHWVVDGKAGPGTPATGPDFEFSPDSAHFAYSLVSEDGKGMALILDGRIRAIHPAVVAGPVFHQDGTLEYLTRSEEGLHRLRVSGY